jgi:RsiW-degrading membrane proteinase PrsW (M82 family)
MGILVSLLPLLAYLAVLVWARRGDGETANVERARTLEALVAIALGFGLAVPVALLERWIAAALMVDPRAHVAGAWGSALASLLLFAPLEEGSKLALAWRLFRRRSIQSPRRATLYASALAMGFATFENALYTRDARALGQLSGAMAGLVVARVLLSTLARLFAASFWGYALGRTTAKKRADRVLFGMWAAATVVHGLCDHLVFGRGGAAMLGALPLYAGMLVVTYLGARELVPKQLPRWANIEQIPILHSIAPPSLTQMRIALRRSERPVMLRWIALGTLVTMGVILTSVVGAVVAGRKLGVDFGVVDEGEVTAALPLLLIGLGVLVAFPAAGFLVARASATTSVLEPALAAALAIVGTLVMLGLAAPVALIFALAFAPIAFGLACAGAWAGIGGSRG